ncbi:hypothetical protein BGZ50_009036 [Haplosporangium sp. Z 11]|nr:hypothetical protein BGZ50_009036 [Haplosporangium sp. Z 11]
MSRSEAAYRAKSVANEANIKVNKAKVPALDHTNVTHAATLDTIKDLLKPRAIVVRSIRKKIEEILAHMRMIITRNQCCRQAMKGLQITPDQSPEETKELLERYKAILDEDHRKYEELVGQLKGRF